MSGSPVTNLGGAAGGSDPTALLQQTQQAEQQAEQFQTQLATLNMQFQSDMAAIQSSNDAAKNIKS